MITACGDQASLDPVVTSNVNPEGVPVCEISGAAGDEVSCSIAMTGTQGSQHAVAFQFDLNFDNDLIAFKGLHCSDGTGTNLCADKRLPSGHEIHWSDASDTEQIDFRVLAYSMETAVINEVVAIGQYIETTPSKMDNVVPSQRFVLTADRPPAAAKVLDVIFKVKQDVENMEILMNKVVVSDAQAKALETVINPGWIHTL
jgi:hypothetical protein